jgi:hypothetical protein
MRFCYYSGAPCNFRSFDHIALHRGDSDSKDHYRARVAGPDRPVSFSSKGETERKRSSTSKSLTLLSWLENIIASHKMDTAACKAMAKPSTETKSRSPIVSEGPANEERCEQILECKRQIIFWTKKLTDLEKEQNKRIKLARLRVDAANYWVSLSEVEQRNKEFILAALESEEMPDEFDDFSNNSFPVSIRKDRDVFLARVDRDDFTSKYHDDRLFVPPNLRADKEVILKVIAKHAAVVESMACSLRQDVDVFLALLSNTELPHHVLQHFSEEIRSDHELMLKLCAHSDGLHSMSFVSQSLRNSKGFMLEAIRVCQHRNLFSSPVPLSDCLNDPPHILRYASQRLKDDFDVVLAAVEKCGTNLKYASYDSRRNPTIVVAATEQNACAFRYCLPGRTKDKFLGDRFFMLEKVARRAPNDLLRHSKPYFDDLCTDRDVLLFLLEGGLDWVHVPESWQKDKDFVFDAVRRNPKLFMDIDERFQEDFRIASTVIKVENVSDEVVLEATEKCPIVLSDRGSMLAIAKAWWTDVLQETLRYSPIEIRRDKEIMLEAVKNDPHMFEFVSDDLSVDRDIVLAAVETSPAVVFHLISDDFQRDNPDIVVSAINSAQKNDLDNISEYVALELWTNFDVVSAWISKGGDWLEHIHHSFDCNEDLLLAVARENWGDFWGEASHELRSNKDFMLKAVAIDSRLIDDAVDDLRYDYDLALLAFSQSHVPLGCYFNDEGEFSCMVDEEGDEEERFVNDFEFLVSFTTNIRRRIEEYDTFQNVVVDNISKTTSSCTISVLNQGPETVQSHAKLISSFLGLPKQDEVDKLRRASNNLLKWGL